MARAAEIGRACAFDLHLVAPGLPDCRVPAGHTDQSWLAELVHRGATARYGPADRRAACRRWAQIDHELEVIDTLGYAGYFLVVCDIVEFCRRQDIYCQGRGSAANSAVCYALGITRADPVALELLFERFLSPERDGPPDIDIDIESGRREEVIAYVYERYGRHCAAQVANVITYRPRSAIRDMGKALGHAPGTPTPGPRPSTAASRSTAAAPCPRSSGGWPEVLDFPRHLGLHSGGMVLCDRPVVEVCPVEWARHPGRSALQWDKDDCAAAGLVKFDLLGLGMLDAVHRTVDLVRARARGEVDLACIPQEDDVYDMLCRADTVGVFQVESRAQMATLPRIRPRCFDDLVIEVAIIRPGPIQGGSVHPYIRRRQGLEAPDPPHPLLQRALAKTLGVPLFQEQLMQIAIDAAGFTPAEADELRQAMSSKRSGARMAQLSDRLFAGMAERGITGAVAEEIVDKLAAFANFGFPESHAVSFAYLVYSSAWLKLHYPAAFCAGLLDAQPMGFWSPQSLVADARRHGVTVHRPHVDVSGAQTTLAWGLDVAAPRPPGPAGAPTRQPAVRLGLMSVRGVGEARGRADRLWPALCVDGGRRAAHGDRTASARGARHRRRARRAPGTRRRPGDPRPAPRAVGGRRAGPWRRRAPAGARVGRRAAAAARAQPHSRRSRPTCGPPGSVCAPPPWSSPGPASTPWAWSPPAVWPGPRPTARCSWEVSSRTANDRRAPRAPCSSTSRMRPAWSTSSAPPGRGSGGAPAPGGHRRSSCGAASNASTAW